LIAAAAQRQDRRRHALYLHESEHHDGEARDFFADLTAEETARVRQVSSPLQFDPGQEIFCQGQHHTGIFVILSGQVRSYYTGPSGREITLAYWSPGNFVGGPEVFGRGRHMWSGRAMTPTQVLYVRGRELRRLMLEIPKLAISVVEALEHKGKCYSAMIHMLGTRSAAERLAQLLLLMADRDGRPTDDGIVIARTLTHDDLAKMIGATRQWVRTTLDRLHAQGMIELRATLIVITNARELYRFAGYSDELLPASACASG
jgi:CRP/FNR family transcriptional regulator, cyclic AMP receptor protein